MAKEIIYKDEEVEVSRKTDEEVMVAESRGERRPINIDGKPTDVRIVLK